MDISDYIDTMVGYIVYTNTRSSNIICDMYYYNILWIIYNYKHLLLWNVELRAPSSMNILFLSRLRVGAERGL
jgi:hypothetical protein